jgi:hypothetical protein
LLLLTLAVDRRRLPFVASSSLSTLAVVGRRRPQSLVVIALSRVGDGRGRVGTAAPAACGLVVVDTFLVVVEVGLGTATSAARGLIVSCVLWRPWPWWDGGARRSWPHRCGATAPAVHCLVVINICCVGDSRGRGGTAAPAARDLGVVDVGRVGTGRGCGGMAAPAARGRVVIDVGRGTAAPAVRSLAVIDVGRVGDGCGRGGMAAPATRDLAIVDAGVVLLSALDGRDCFRAVDGRPPPPLGFSPRSPACLPRRSQLLGGGCTR